MENVNTLLAPELRELIAAGDAAALKEFCESAHPASVAELLAPLSGPEIWSVLRHADPEVRVDIFSHLDTDRQDEMVVSLRRDEAAPLLSEMPADDRADLFKRLSEPVRAAILPALAQAERKDIRCLTSYGEGTAGAAMTSEYAFLYPEYS